MAVKKIYLIKCYSFSTDPYYLSVVTFYYDSRGGLGCLDVFTDGFYIYSDDSIEDYLEELMTFSDESSANLLISALLALDDEPRKYEVACVSVEVSSDEDPAAAKLR